MNISNANLGLLQFSHWNAISSNIIERIVQMTFARITILRIVQMTFARITILQGSDVSWISIVYLVSKAI